MEVGSERKHYTVSHPIHLKPDEDLLSFIHHPLFTRDWKELGLDDDDLAELELCVMVGPKEGRLEPGTGGLRIIRVGPDARPERPPFRVFVYYVFFEDRSIVALLAAESADGDADISDEDRQQLRVLINEIEEEL